MNNSILLQDSNVSKSMLATDKMTASIQRWLNMYVGSAESETTLGLPAAIASEISRLVTLELVYKVVTPAEHSPENNNPSAGVVGDKIITLDKEQTRAEYLDEQLRPFLEKIRIYTEYGAAGGGIMFKPYVDDDDNIAIDVSIANDFFPLAFNSRGKITSCAFVEHKRVGNKYYHRIETHEYNAQSYKVTNEAFCSYQKDTKGKPCSLKEVPEWENLTPVQNLGDVPCPLFSYFRIPEGNSVDMTSPLGVSVFYRAIPQIIEADKQWDRYLWEFESGAMLMEANKDAFPMDKNGEPIIPEGKERLFWITEFDSTDAKSSGKLTEFHAPSLREVAQKAGLNSILQRVEFNSGLAYGTLSDPNTIDKTATEIKASKQRSYSTVTDIQKALKESLDDLVAAMNVYATLYHLSPDGAYEISDIWDDSIVVDADTERTRDMNEVRMGVMKKWEYRVKWYGEDEETAKAAVEADAPTDNPFATS